MEVSRVQADTLEHVWTQLAPMVERSMRHGAGDSTTPEQVLASIIRGDAILWVIHDGPEIVAGLVISVQKHPAKLVVLVEACAGRDLDKWIEQIETLLRDYRDLVGADTIEATCRSGLAKRLGKRGWSAKATIMELK